MHGGASGVGGAAELGMEAPEPARSANKGTARESILSFGTFDRLQQQPAGHPRRGKNVARYFVREVSE